MTGIWVLFGHIDGWINSCLIVIFFTKQHQQCIHFNTNFNTVSGLNSCTKMWKITSWVLVHKSGWCTFILILIIQFVKEACLKTLDHMGDRVCDGQCDLSSHLRTHSAFNFILKHPFYYFHFFIFYFQIQDGRAQKASEDLEWLNILFNSIIFISVCVQFHYVSTFGLGLFLHKN